jgi:hypothetical protein
MFSGIGPPPRHDIAVDTASNQVVFVTSTGGCWWGIRMSCVTRLFASREGTRLPSASSARPGRARFKCDQGTACRPGLFCAVELTFRVSCFANTAPAQANDHAIGV